VSCRSANAHKSLGLWRERERGGIARRGVQKSGPFLPLERRDLRQKREESDGSLAAIFASDFAVFAGLRWTAPFCRAPKFCARLMQQCATLKQPSGCEMPQFLRLAEVA
jgi:hypothetical protein